MTLPSPNARPRVPVSTYRFQVHGGFPLPAATAVLPYLVSLGVSDAYTSPLLAATAGSTHGYDVTDPETVSPDVGGKPALAAFHAELKRLRLGHLLDIVPNHMAATPDNAWWADVLAHGEASPFARHFDVDFLTPPRASDRGRVVLPILGEPSAAAADAGHVRLAFDDHGANVHVYIRRLPLDPRTLPLVLGHAPRGPLADLARAAGKLAPRTDPAGYAEALAVIARVTALVKDGGEALDHARHCAEVVNADPAKRDAVLAAQAYRLTHWRAGADEVNYRRFFDVSDLVALRADRPEVFAATHKVLLDMLAAGDVTGLRVDHPDGLADPAGYLERLQQAAKAFTKRPAYVSVEKILAPGEPLRPEWACSGTTGYEFITAVTQLLVDPAGERAMTDLYHEFAGRSHEPPDLVTGCKMLVLDTSFGGDLGRVADLLFALSQSTRAGRDFSRAELHAAVRATVAAFPAYRSYVTDKADPADVDLIDRAALAAAERLPTHAAAVRFARANLLLTDPAPGDLPDAEQAAHTAGQREFAARFQQLTAPATAKGFEDTTLYRYARLLALNEVGGDPARFGGPAADVHAFFSDRPKGSLNPLSTHDTKRGEDARARLVVLSEIPGEWRETVERWRGLNARHKPKLADGRVVPSANEEYLFYQAILGSRPPAGEADPGNKPFDARMAEFAVKALHEAKEASSWRDPDPAYDAAVCEFLGTILDPPRAPEFVADLDRFTARIARPALHNTLAQTLLRLTAPGVPDTYQGSELWDHSLVDPDNRRPVDYARRAALLADLDARADADPAGLCADLLRDPADPRIKLFVTARALRFRRDRPTVFADGDYTPLTTTGPAADRVFAFLREFDGRTCLIAVPRLTAGLRESDPWAETRAELPPAWAGKRWTCAFTGRTHDAGPAVDCAALFAELPVALMTAE